MSETPGWTAQSDRAYVEPDQIPGQKFGEHQLPDVADHVPAELIAEKGDPQGPEPWEDGKTTVLLDGPVFDIPELETTEAPVVPPEGWTVNQRGAEPEAAEEAPVEEPKAKHKKAAEA